MYYQTLDRGASASFICRYVLHGHQKILKQKKNKWSTMTGTFNTASKTELKLKLPGFNHSPEAAKKILFIKYHFIQGGDMLHKLCIIFNCENKKIT